MSSTRTTPAYPTLENRDGDGVVNFDGEDIVEKNRQTLRSYLRSITLGETPSSNNAAVIEYNGQLPPNHGNAFPLNSSPDIRQTGFTDQPGLSNAVSLSQEPSEMFGDVERIVDQGDLGKANSDINLTGHELLAGVIGSDISNGSVKTSTAGAKRYVETLGSSLKKKNLNVGSLKVTDTETGSTTNIIKDYEFTGESSGTRKTIERVKLGDTLSGVASTSFDVNDPKFIDEKDMKKVATFLLNQAMGNKKVQSGESLVKNSSSKIRPARAPGFQNFNRTTLSDGEDSIPSGETEGGRYTDVSWGQHYSPSEKYTGASTGREMFIAAAKSIAVIALVVAVLSAFIPKINISEIPAEVNSSIFDSRKLVSGEFKIEPSEGSAGAIIGKALSFASNLTGLSVNNPFYIPTNPRAGYGDCVIAGLASFLGAPYEIDEKLIIGSTLKINLNTPIIFAKIAVRFGALLLDTNERLYYPRMLRLLNQDFIALRQRSDEVGDASGLKDKALEAFDFLENLFDSRLFAFINTLAKVGDLVYKQAVSRQYRNSDVELTPEDAYDNNSATSKIGFASLRIRGSKLTGRRGVTYAASDLPSNYLIPRGSSQIYEKLIDDIGIAKRIKSQKQPAGKNKFSPEQVAQVENILEAEYMPFYFQDLRTNEIIAFHAFLEDLSDSYSANYNSTNAYGRVDEIKTYKDTKRSVGLTFQLVSVNPDDFNYIWWQINKLTTMVYPQWSRGRQLQVKNDISTFNFTQPFSQIPTASPLIRVRVGDLIRSNYSRFNLKRLFGFQDVDLKQTIKSVPPERVYTAAVDTIIEINEKFYTIKEELKFTDPMNEGSKQKIKPLSLSIKATEHYSTNEESVVLFGSIVKIPNYQFNNNCKFEVEQTLVAGDFYNPESNSIIKSFETTQGQGLAAVITQLQFTWMDGLWGVGEDGPGNRAPRSCKIQMSFEPIHDIAPGLDSDGFNRAPIYPVGNVINNLIEGGEDQPYGVGTSTKGKLVSSIAEKKSNYTKQNEPSVLSKILFG